MNLISLQSIAFFNRLEDFNKLWTWVKIELFIKNYSYRSNGGCFPTIVQEHGLDGNFCDKDKLRELSEKASTIVGTFQTI